MYNCAQEYATKYVCEETRRFSQHLTLCIQININYGRRFVNYITNVINDINTIINIIFFTSYHIHSTRKPVILPRPRFNELSISHTTLDLPTTDATSRPREPSPRGPSRPSMFSLPSYNIATVRTHDRGIAICASRNSKK